MRPFGVVPFLIFGFILVSAPLARAVEEGQLVKKDGRWQYVSTEDPGLKYLYLKGIITQQEYEKGLKVIEAKDYAAKPNYSVDVNNGLNIRVGEKFLLEDSGCSLKFDIAIIPTMKRGGSIGDSRNPEILGGQVEFRAVRHQSDTE